MTEPPDPRTINPAEGIYFGYGWGRAIQEIVSERPDAKLVEAKAERAVLELATTLDVGGVAMTPQLEFELDALTAVTLRCEALKDADAAMVAAIFDAASAWFNGALPEPVDEGCWRVEYLGTQLTFDLWRGALTFVDLER